jgi:hypothetical protein
MSVVLISIVTLIYLGVAVTYMFEGKAGFALTFLAYAIANVGIMMAAR